MPTVLKTAGFRFFFYSNEGDPLEAPHVHVAAAGKIAKFWLNPVELARSKNLRSSEIGTLQRLVEQNRDAFLEAWNAHFYS